MITFTLAFCLLIGGYFIYGLAMERIFGVNPSNRTPAYTLADGVDYVPMNWWRIFLIQFLNIAGLGPIFGAVMGAVYGPSAFLWIVFGSIFGGAVHDYLSGMMSLRNKGMSLPELGGKYVGNLFRLFMRIFTLVLMILVGAVFIAGPAKLLNMMTNNTLDYTLCIVMIFIYYVLATLLPVDKVIGRIYPFFGAALLFMAAGIGISLITAGENIPELTLETLGNQRPDGDRYPLFPMLFISIACGAISGFHATQSPMMARCLTSERYGRRVFYGAMIVEGAVALIWAAAAMSFFGSAEGLFGFLDANGQNAAVAVRKICDSWLGKFGGILAIIGVIVAPITSGDTAFRSARLIVADFLGISQKKLANRIMISVPLFVIGFILLQINFDIIWRYFAWANQTLATATLWMISIYLVRHKKFFAATLIPALFMSMVVIDYILIAPEGFAIHYSKGLWIAAFITFLLLLWFIARYFNPLGSKKNINKE
ncbi:MAG: carbon starvation protein A [Prevotellaceae bacterium]|jgi:carbon starvation protein CstA|nr:carbon starvation protein A [Prevotellaceae bacterium]